MFSQASVIHSVHRRQWVSLVSCPFQGDGYLWYQVTSGGMSGGEYVYLCTNLTPDRGPGDTVRMRLELECFLVSCIIIKLYFPVFLRISCRREVDVDEVLSPHQKCHNPRRILLEGASGTGKSLLCHYLAYGWATRKITSLERYCAPV